MPDAEISGIRRDLTRLEDASLKSIEISTTLSKDITSLIIEMKERDVKNDYMFKEFSNAANRINETIETTNSKIDEHIKIADPVLLRSKRFQDNIDIAKRGVLSKSGIFVISLILLLVSYSLGVDPSTIKF